MVATLSAAPETIEAVEKDGRLPRLSSEGSSLENRLLRRIMPTVAELRRAKLTGYVALLRAVNVGGTGKLPMKILTQICETAGFGKAKTYIASPSYSAD